MRIANFFIFTAGIMLGTTFFLPVAVAIALGFVSMGFILMGKAVQNEVLKVMTNTTAANTTKAVGRPIGFAPNLKDYTRPNRRAEFIGFWNAS